MMNTIMQSGTGTGNIYAEGAKAVFQFLGEAIKVSGPVCEAIVKYKCRNVNAAVEVTKKVLEETEGISKISEQFFQTYRATMQLVEKTHQTTVEKYMIMIANEEGLTFEQKADKLLEMQRVSNKAGLDSKKVTVAGAAGTLMVGAAIWGGTLAYGRHCDMVKSLARSNTIKSMNPLAGVNELLFALADAWRRK